MSKVTKDFIEGMELREQEREYFSCLYTAVEEERDKYHKALINLKKHIEVSSPSGYRMSAAWNIANNALEG